MLAMSSSTPTNDRRQFPVVPIPSPLKAGAFWTAVLLPFITVALVLAGVVMTTDYATLGVLVAANVLALLVGHDYSR